MAEHVWQPVDVDDDGYTAEITYRNEEGEEYLHVTDSYGGAIRCWRGCSGEWPACRRGCLIFDTARSTGLTEAYLRSARCPGFDPFDHPQHRESFIDDNNLYVERFETLDGVRWEIAVDVDEQLLEMLDEKTRDEECR